jgi:hypothetical protein
MQAFRLRRRRATVEWARAGRLTQVLVAGRATPASVRSTLDSLVAVAMQALLVHRATPASRWCRRYAVIVNVDQR